MAQLSPASFGLLALLILLGGSLALPVAPIFYRRYIYRKIKASYPKDISVKAFPVLAEFDLQDRALAVMVRIIFTYIVGVMTAGFMILYGALHIFAEDPELVERGYSRVANAWFISISAFNNAGYTISSESIFHLQNNPLAYLTIAVLILAGNTMAPVCYRLLIMAELHLRDSFKIQHDTAELQFILDNPRKVSVNTLPTREVIFLFITTTALNFVQYIFYLASCLDREQTRNEYGSQMHLAGIGFFQTISTRNAGLQIMDLRTMNQGMLLVYGMAMYLSGAPFVTALYASEDSSETTAKTTRTSTRDSGQEDTNATTTGDESDFSDDDDGNEDEDDNEESSSSSSSSCKDPATVEPIVAEESKEKEVEPPMSAEEREKQKERRRQEQRQTRRGGFLLSTKAPGPSAVSLTTGATNTCTSTAEETGVLDAMESMNKLPRSRDELDVPLQGCLRRKSSAGEIHPWNVPTPSSARRGSSVSRMTDMIRSSIMLEPSDSQIACSVNEALVGTVVATDPVADQTRRRSSHTVTFDGAQIEPTTRMTTHTDGATPAASRRSSSSTGAESANDMVPSFPGSAPAAAYGAEPMNRRGSITNMYQGLKRRSSLVSLVDEIANLSPAAMANVPVRTHEELDLSASPGTINDAQFRALVRHNSVQILNQRKFEIQNKFVETFIMKHSFFIGLGVFVCAFSEDGFMMRQPEVVNLWYIIFEVVSAYGNVGLSLNAPGQGFSLCGNFGPIGKLAIILVMLLGKHRGLPKEGDAVIDFKFRRLKRAVAAIVAQQEQDTRMRQLEEGRFIRKHQSNNQSDVI
jgi:Trk-type K+ transport system membrane component